MARYWPAALPGLAAVSTALARAFDVIDAQTHRLLTNAHRLGERVNSELRTSGSAAAEPRSANSFTIMAAGTAATGGFLFGYDTGVISGALLFLSSSFALSTEMQGVVTSAVLAGACLAAGFGGWLADHFGRRFVMLDVALLFIIGALLSAFAGSVGALLLGRFLIGMCIGVVSFVAPLYIAEIAPPRHRGKLVSLNQLAITIGILVSYIVDTAYAAEGGWRWMLGLGAIPGILLAIGMAYLPESPRWLLKVGRETEAANVLKQVHGSADVIAEIADIKADLELERDTIGWR